MVMERSGSSDSAAAIVMISIPPKAKATTSSPAATPPNPLGAKPSAKKTRAPTKSVPGRRPKISSTPMIKNAEITATLMKANQYSNSPKPRTAARFTTVKNMTQTRAGIQPGIPNQAPIMAPAPVISAPITITSRNQYNQPTEKPAQWPKAMSA